MFQGIHHAQQDASQDNSLLEASRVPRLCGFASKSGPGSQAHLLKLVCLAAEGIKYARRAMIRSVKIPGKSCGRMFGQTAHTRQPFSQ